MAEEKKYIKGFLHGTTVGAFLAKIVSLIKWKAIIAFFKSLIA